jgi:hypothetical protein
MLDAATYQRDFGARFSQSPRHAAGDAGPATCHERDATFKNSISECFMIAVQTSVRDPRPRRRRAQTEVWPPSPARDEWSRALDVQLALHIGPFDVLLLATEDAFDASRRCGQPSLHRVA